MRVESIGEHDDFTLGPDSPAPELGIKPLATADAGPRKAVER